MAEYAPWEPDSPTDAMAEAIRRQVVDIVLGMERVTIWRELDPVKQIECIVGGMLVGLIGTVFAHIRPEGRDELMTFIIEYIPQARDQAEAIMDGAAPGEKK